MYGNDLCALPSSTCLQSRVSASVIFQASSFKQYIAVFRHGLGSGNQRGIKHYMDVVDCFTAWSLTLYNFIEGTVYCFCTNCV